LNIGIYAPDLSTVMLYRVGGLAHFIDKIRGVTVTIINIPNLSVNTNQYAIVNKPLNKQKTL